MKSQKHRLRTFYSIKDFSVVEKNDLVTKGFYAVNHQLFCFKCDSMYENCRSNLSIIDLHNCPNSGLNNMHILSPYENTMHGPIKMTDDLNYEEFRYATFRNCSFMKHKGYPNQYNLRTAQELAAAGFYNTLNNNTAKCFYCNEVLNINRYQKYRTFGNHDTNIKCQQTKKQMKFNVNSSSGFNSHFSNLRNIDTIIWRPNKQKPGRSRVFNSPNQQQLNFDQFFSDPARNAIFNKCNGFDKDFVKLADSNTADTISQKFEKINREMKCKICMDRKVNVIFKPCHHAVACFECGHTVSLCPICSKTINECSKIYF